MMKNLLLGLGVIGMSITVSAQNKIADKYGKGLTLLGKDSTFYMKANTRIQSRYDYQRLDNNSGDVTEQDRAYVRRARIKFSGWAYSPKVKYKIEHDVLNGVTYDAVIKYNFFKGMEIWAGQTKLPGNRERVISSQKLQFVDRSLLNTNFTLDRDAGLQLRNKHKFGKVIVKEMFAVSQGEGLNDKSFGHEFGHEYTGRLEVLPFGKFTSKGDYFGSDLKREKTSKLAFGLTYDFNQNQMTSRKVKGAETMDSRDVMSIQADFMYKLKGFSLMGEYANMDVVGTRGTIGLDDDNNLKTVYFMAGEGVNLQA
jgi:phosphate-selective porin OprO/OprP